jgi:seryl-tRNA synthetase
MKVVELEGCHWSAIGETAFSGTALRLFRGLDRLFVRLASAVGAQEIAVPSFISVVDLARVDYFRAFPHQVGFPITLESSEANLRAFAAGCDPDAGGALRLTGTDAVRAALTPAACYHLYPLLQQRELPVSRFFTTRARCYRKETTYVPLQRQWAFSMREIVSIGSESDVRTFLDVFRARLEAICAEIWLPIAFEPATDPFFDPSHSPRWVLQKVEPVKTELVYGGELAIGSINFHQDFFGRAFGIRCGGSDAFSGCVAFGVERWMHAIADRFGPRAQDWPLLLEAGVDAVG